MEMEMGRRWVVSAALAVMGFAGCSTSSQPPVMTPARRGEAVQDSTGTAPPRAARRMRFALTAQSVDGLDAVRGIAKEELERTGFWVTDETAPSDATLDVRVMRADDSTSTAEGCAFQGKQISLALVRGDQPLDWFVMPIRCDANVDAPRVAIRGLVRQLSGSPRLQALADAADRRPPPPSAPSETRWDERTRDDLAWNPAAVRRCRNARTASACKTLIAYLSEFPSGAHSADARAVLGQVEP